MAKGEEPTVNIGLRYESLRALGSGLAAAITLDDVCDVVADRIGNPVGVAAAGVVRWADSEWHWHPQPAPGSSIDIARLFASKSRQAALAEAIAGGTPVAVDLSAANDGARGQGLDTVMVYPIADSSGLRAAIALAFSDGGIGARNSEHIKELVALSSAALVRAWATRRARELGAIMDSLLEQAPIGFAFIDPYLRYVHVNERLAEFNGHDVEAHLGQTVGQIVPDLAQDLEPILRNVLETGIPTDKIEVSGETDAEAGTERVFEAAYLPVTLDDDEVVGIVTVVDDVTEQRRARQDLQRRYARERDIATRMQRGLTPRNLPCPQGYELAVKYVAGSGDLRIGGDWYDVIELGPDRFAVVIGDVVGHGLNAALAMVRIRHALAGLSYAVPNPGQVLERLDEYATEDEDRFAATLVYGLLEPATGTITLSSAGHPPPLIIKSDGDIIRVDAGKGTPIGVTASGRPWTSVTLQPGDCLLLYTDGVFEERGTSIDAGLQRLADVAAKPFETATDLVDNVLTEVPAQEHTDDIALLALRRL